MPPSLADRERAVDVEEDEGGAVLAVPAQRADDAAVNMLGALRERYAVGIVGAGDFEKQTMQLHGDLHARASASRRVQVAVLRAALVYIGVRAPGAWRMLGIALRWMRNWRGCVRCTSGLESQTRAL